MLLTSFASPFLAFANLWPLSLLAFTFAELLEFLLYVSGLRCQSSALGLPPLRQSSLFRSPQAVDSQRTAAAKLSQMARCHIFVLLKLDGSSSFPQKHVESALAGTENILVRVLWSETNSGRICSLCSTIQETKTGVELKYRRSTERVKNADQKVREFGPTCAVVYPRLGV